MRPSMPLVCGRKTWPSSWPGFRTTPLVPECNKGRVAIAPEKGVQTFAISRNMTSCRIGYHPSHGSPILGPSTMLTRQQRRAPRRPLPASLSTYVLRARPYRWPFIYGSNGVESNATYPVGLSTIRLRYWRVR